MKKVIIYTDGACSGNPCPGGWGAILQYNGQSKEISGNNEFTTNNQMELTAAIQALNLLKEPCDVELYSDSAYLINAFVKGWVKKWKNANWTRKKDELKNIDLWKTLDKFDQIHNIKWIKVKGHSDNEFNNLCDKLATQAIKVINN